MSPQRHKKATTWINLNTVITSLCTAALVWVGTGQVKMYNAILLQPKIDEKQTLDISNIAGDVKELKSATADMKNQQTVLGGKVFFLEAMLPDKNQFKIKH